MKTLLRILRACLMLTFNQRPEVQVTRANIEWVIEFTGRSREYIMEALRKAEAKGVVCTVSVVWS